MAVSISEFTRFAIVQEDNCLNGANMTKYAYGPCRVTAIHAWNQDAGAPGPNFLKMFDNADPTWGTTAPDFSFPIPAGDGTEYGALHLDFHDEPLVFENGLSLGADDAGGTATGTAPSANDVLVILEILPGAS